MECCYCPKTSEKITSMKNHIEQKHTLEEVGQKSVEAEMFSCSKCDKTYHTEKLLRRHIAMSHEFKESNACSVCGKKFIQLSHLTAHVRSVHHQITLPCNNCDKKFSSESNLKRHMKSRCKHNKKE